MGCFWLARAAQRREHGFSRKLACGRVEPHWVGARYARGRARSSSGTQRTKRTTTRVCAASSAPHHRATPAGPAPRASRWTQSPKQPTRPKQQIPRRRAWRARPCFHHIDLGRSPARTLAAGPRFHGETEMAEAPRTAHGVVTCRRCRRRRRSLRGERRAGCAACLASQCTKGSAQTLPRCPLHAQLRAGQSARKLQQAEQVRSIHSIHSAPRIPSGAASHRTT